MLRRYWLPIFAVIGLATGAYAQGVSHNARSGPTNNQGQHKSKTDTSPAIPVTVQNDIHSIAGTLHAESQKQKTTEEIDHDKRNLAAQEDMAKWASRMFGVGIFETLVTLTGVVLVALTLRHTRRAADAARDTVNSMRDTAKRQLRAYVVIDEVNKETRYTWPPEFVLTIKNAGQTPAHKLTVRTREIVATTEPVDADLDIQTAAEYEIPLGPGHTSEHLLPRESLRDVCATCSYEAFMRDRLHTLYIAGEIKYDDVFGNEQQTNFRFAYGPGDAENGNVTFCLRGNVAT